MKKQILKTEVLVYDSENKLPDIYQKLLKQAHIEVGNAYAPYSNFRVGAAILLENGEIIGGSNQENAAYPVCICAERVALSAAAALYPDTAIKAIALTAKSPSMVLEQPVSPCGTCRQFMIEVQEKHQQKYLVFLQGETGPVYQIDSPKDLLPLYFDASVL